MAAEEGIALVDKDEQGVDRAFREEVLTGLSYDQKAVPARWLYDDDGSQLFEDITQVEEYYPTRAETEILTERGADFANAIGPGRAVVEFGSGSSVKTPLLLRAIDPAAYVPLDIAGDFLRAAAADLAQQFPGPSCRGGFHQGSGASARDRRHAQARFLHRVDDRQHGAAHRGRPAPLDARHAGCEIDAADRDGPREGPQGA